MRLRRPDSRLSLGLVVLTCAASALAYLWRSQALAGPGYPLDDAWIHQTYARNLAERGEWAFVPGQPSAGSTAPLWTILIALGRGLGVDPATWTYLLGTAAFSLTALTVRRWMSRRSAAHCLWPLLAAMVVALEWHLVWAAVSGMETAASALIAMVSLSMIDKPKWSGLALGLLVGLGMWIRPDLLTLLIPALWVLAWRSRQDRKGSAYQAIALALGLAFAAGPYLALNKVVGGDWLPSTFYAKQSEYAVLRYAPIFSRLLQQALMPLVGVGAVLLPGIFCGLLRRVRQHEWNGLAPHLWVLSFLTLYALRLPVVYQHGRYIMPALPVLAALGMEGLSLVAALGSPKFWPRVASRVWLAALPCVLGVFWLRGACAYAEDVAIIETEMVESGLWIAANTEPGARIAAHDIGALGYYGERPVIDLAGLVSKGVIPLIRDETALAEYLTEQRADYLMTFPGWYPLLVAELEPVHVTGAPFSPTAGGENMVVYRWGLP